MMEWISTKIRLPEQLVEVVVYDKDHGITLASMYRNNWGTIPDCCCSIGDRLEHVTHWLEYWKIPVPDGE